MKKLEIILKTTFLASLLILVMMVFSCKKETDKMEDTKEVATDQNDQKFDNNDEREDDSAFLVAAAETDLMEIEIGKLAQTKGTHQGVKDFGKMLVDEHTKSANETKPLAEKLGVSLPTAITDKGKEHYADLNGKEAGKDFDQKFADMMVDGHEEAIRKMEKAAKNGNSPEVQSWASAMLPSLKMHLDHAKKLQDELK